MKIFIVIFTLILVSCNSNTDNPSTVNTITRDQTGTTVINVDNVEGSTINIVVNELMEEPSEYIEEDIEDEIDVELSETTSYPHDLERIGALREEKTILKTTEKLIAEFDLSEDRAYEVSKIMYNWKEIYKSRAMTESDNNHIIQALTGCTIDDVKYTISSQNFEDYENFIEDAADFNGITTESMREIFNKFVK